MHRKVYVVVTNELVNGLHGYTPDRYPVYVPNDEPAETQAGIALDVFHSTIPIKDLDDYIFTVEDENGDRLPEDPFYESYSRSNDGYMA